MSMNSFIDGLIVAMRHRLSTEQKRVAAIRARPASKFNPSAISSCEQIIASINKEIDSLQTQLAVELPKVEILGATYEIVKLQGPGGAGEHHMILINHRAYEIEYPTIPDVARECGNKAKTYDAYLIDWATKHPNAMVIPQSVHYFSPEYSALNTAMGAMEKIDDVGKFYKAGHFPVSRHALLDGRVIERTCDVRGVWIYAVFPSREHADNYNKPQSWKEFWNEW